MRIPSDFSDDNLYRRRADKSGATGKNRASGQLNSNNTARRLLRLIVGLVVVIFLMRHASRPEIYQTFFAEPLQKIPDDMTRHNAIPPISDGGEFADVDGSGSSVSTQPPTSEDREAGGLYSEDSPQFRDATRIVDQWPREVQRKLLSPLLLTTSMASEMAEPIHTAIVNLKSDEIPLEVPSESWLALSERFQEGTDLDNDQRRQVAALRLAAMKAALGRVVDGSVWRSADLDAFYGSLAQRDLIASFDREQTGVLPLLQQPEVYRGRGITVSGQVVRGERLDATPNTFGIERYWQLWLRVADGSQRPLVAIVKNLPAGLESRVTSENDNEMLAPSDAPHVIIEGVYLKRLAYRSTQGAELAPAIVGSIAAMSVVAASNESLSGNQIESPTAINRSTWLTLVMTVAAGILIAAFVTIRTNRANARLRALRSQQHESDLSFSVVSIPESSECDVSQSARDENKTSDQQQDVNDA